jgi:hypothetical protein
MYRTPETASLWSSGYKKNPNLSLPARLLCGVYAAYGTQNTRYRHLSMQPVSKFHFRYTVLIPSLNISDVGS